ncbi:replication initiation protein [Persicobacter diffluens]|uniref:replication initiation protein n=1 Tax=Persicobacter diffluens TaxID=981 RepID=UPI0030C661D9
MEKNQQYRLIVKSNKLVNSRQHFTATQQRIVLSALARIKENEENLTFQIPMHEVIGEKEIGGSQIDLVKTALNGLMQSYVEMEKVLEDGKKKWVKISFISRAEGIEGEGQFELKFDSEMKEFLLNLKSNFTKYFLHNVSNFRKSYSIRIYELCKQYHPKILERKFTIAEFKFLLGIESKYPYVSALKKNILDPSLEEINNHSDLFISYELLPENRRSKKEIVFKIASNIALEDNSNDLDSPKQLESVDNKGIDKDAILSKEEYIDNYMADKPGIRDQGAYKSKLAKDEKFDLQYREHIRSQEQKIIDEQVKAELKEKERLSKEREVREAAKLDNIRAEHFNWSKSIFLKYFDRYSYQDYKDEVLHFLRANYTSVLDSIMGELLEGKLSQDTKMRIGKFLFFKLGEPEEIEMVNDIAKWKKLQEVNSQKLEEEQKFKEQEKRRLEEEIRRMTEQLKSM